jgi:EmrB/QacA subfamily drug resistance transporter
VLGSGIASLDATVVNVALPAIGTDLNASVAGLQWVLTGYLITLASLILVGGSLGDLFGRRRVFRIGVVWFSVASLLSGLAPNLATLIAARALQGIGGALLTPGSLAIIESAFVPEDRGRAIGTWSGLGGIATAIGPFAGGWLVTAVSWRLIFLLNLPLAALVLWATRQVPESADPGADRRIDKVGAFLAVIGLASVTYALIEGPSPGTAPLVTIVAGIIGVGGLAAFVVFERESGHPMLPVGIFASRQFSSANLVTVAVYAALGGTFFLLAVDLQQSLHYSPVAAGASLLPVTAIMLVFSSRAGALAQRIGPRIPMTIGPVLVAIGLLLMRRINPGGTYVPDVLPAMIVFAGGLSLTVAPLTATVLAAADDRRAGVASGVNNALARAAGLIAVAVLPALAGITGSVYRVPRALTAGFHRACLITAGLCLAGAVIAWVGVRKPIGPPALVNTEATCAVDGPPLRQVRRSTG